MFSCSFSCLFIVVVIIRHGFVVYQVVPRDLSVIKMFHFTVYHVMINQLLKLWIHKIGRKDLRVSASTRVCSRHFVSSKGRKLRPNEYPTLNLPTLPTQVTQPRKQKSPRKRKFTLSTVKTVMIVLERLKL